MTTCDKCGEEVTIDIFLPHAIWQDMKPLNTPMGGYLCPKCIGIELKKRDVQSCQIIGFITWADLKDMEKENK